MSRETLGLSPELADYVLRKGVREHPALARCREETAELGRAAQMQIAPEQGAFLALLVRLGGARRVIEIGTFTGYSALAMALALPPDGRLVACDVSDEYVARARGYWREAGVEGRIEARIAPARETLDALLDAGEAGSFDLAFIDADKTGYDAYYEHCLGLVRAGGLIAIDNVLWSGSVADPQATSEDTEALRALNDKIHGDERVDMALVPIADGVTLTVKR